MTEPVAADADRAHARAAVPLRLRAVRLAFGSLERAAPGLGARWAFRLWTRLPTQRSTQRDERPRPGERSTVSMAGGRRVEVESWGSGPAVYLAHGWGGWRGQMGAFVDGLVAAGLRAVAYDAPSHGASGPGSLGAGRSSMLELSETLRAVADAHGAPAGVIAHSGGAMAASAAVRDGLSLPRAVMIAPAVDAAMLIDALQAAVGFGQRIRGRVEARTLALAGRPLADFDVVRLGELAEVPAALVVHDLHDKEVPVEQARRVSAAWPGAELWVTEGLGHRRILRDPAVVERAVGFVTA